MSQSFENPILTQRLDYADHRLDELRQAISRISVPRDDVAVYVTGSFGRMEANQYSDLDIFFLVRGSAETDAFTKVEEVELLHQLVSKCRELGFPEFTKGGTYLKFHHVDDMLKVLGSPEDDAQNHFTARLLLLLESKPLLNEPVLNELMTCIVKAYFRDFHDHAVNFQPAFLINDLHRYWITMCLNYEHNRSNSPDEYGKSKAKLKNIKLKFSRLLTCYSMIIPLLAERNSISPDTVIALSQKTPIGRMLDLAAENPDLADDIHGLLDHYAWFLETFDRSEEENLAWIADETNRTLAHDKAREFGRSVFAVVKSAPAHEDRLRYLVI